MAAGRHVGFCYRSKITSRRAADCQCLLSCQIWWQYLKRRQSYCNFAFSKWLPPSSWILLDVIFRPPTKSTQWPEAMFKILCRSDLYIRIYCDFNFRKFGLKCLFGPRNRFLGISPPKHFGLSSRPQKALPCAEPRILTYRSSKSVNRGDLQARCMKKRK